MVRKQKKEIKRVNLFLNKLITEFLKVYLSKPEDSRNDDEEVLSKYDSLKQIWCNEVYIWNHRKNSIKVRLESFEEQINKIMNKSLTTQ